MSFFQVDDQLFANHKVRTLVESALEGHIEGMAAGFLWTLAGSQCQAVGTDGVVSRADLVRIVLNPTIADRLAALLVDVGLWHRAGHTCDSCPAVPAGSYVFHDWFQMRYTPAKQVRTNRRKRQELKDANLIAQVWARDCTDPADPTFGGCRYCGATVKRKDTKSAKRPFLDHVDPRKAAGIRNVVLACRECNQKKGNRTPREAGMTLLPPPRPEPEGDDLAGHGRPPSTAGDDAGPTTPGSSRPVEHAMPAAEDAGTVDRGPSPDGAGPTGRSSTAGDDAGPTTPGSSRPVEHAMPAAEDAGTVDRGPSPDGAGPTGRSSTVGDDAGPTTPGSSRPVEHAMPPVDDRPPADHPPDHSDTRHVPPDRPHRKPRDRPEVKAVPRGCGPGQGQGQGEGWGVGKGTQQPSQPAPDGEKSRRRRRRGRGRSHHPSPGVPSPAGDPQPESLDAGLPPPGVEPPAGGFGSPYWRWRGPPSQVDETDCAEHGLPEPCWKCQLPEENP